MKRMHTLLSFSNRGQQLQYAASICYSIAPPTSRYRLIREVKLVTLDNASKFNLTHQSQPGDQHVSL